MPAFVRVRLALQKKDIVAAKAKERQREGGEVKQKSAEPSVNTRDAIAKSAGVSHDTVNKVERILEIADDRTKRQLERGEDQSESFV